MARTWGACGVEDCTDCLPLFDEANNELPESTEPVCGFTGSHAAHPFAPNGAQVVTCCGVPASS